MYLLRRNDLNSIAEGERTLENIQSLERLRSEELKNLRAQIDAFQYDKVNWARQTKTMDAEIKRLKQKLNSGKRYTSQLEDYCGEAGFPVAAIKEAAISFKSLDNHNQEDSEDENITLITRCPVTQDDTNNEIRPTTSTLMEAEYSPQCVSQLKHQSQNRMDTRLKTGTIPRKSVKISVVKTVRDANNDVTTITRALSCDETSKHREVIGIMPRRGPFQTYWDKLMLQASVYNLEPRDVWQIVLLTIPEELHSKIPQELRSGTILERQLGESNDDIYSRIKEVLIQMRGPPQAEWHRILKINQSNTETFEAFAERMWVTFREYSGAEDCNRNHEILLQMLRNNAGPHIQNALAMGGDPPHNTFNAFVEWATKIEQRSKTLKMHTVAATQWVAEGDNNVIICDYCHRPGHKRERCFKLHGAPQSKFKFRKTTGKSLQDHSKTDSVRDRETTNIRDTDVSGLYSDILAALEQIKKQK
ncbi:hypothetical protein JOB18_017537 [Solea senegalensis]|uniref:Uncharacterized protein n=1 Tax=Solea senegalensis TaxID=28829 RepID=A0AAV6T5V7_SOLSE|nr:hypothetical protein JOB18_017537 [Solea senegalensis]